MLNFPGLNVISPVCSVFLMFCSQSISPFRPAQILSIQKEGKNLQERVELTVVRCKSFVRLWSILWGCHWCLKFPVRKSISSHIFCSIWLAKKALRGVSKCATGVTTEPSLNQDTSVHCRMCLNCGLDSVIWKNVVKTRNYNFNRNSSGW